MTAHLHEVFIHAAPRPLTKSEAAPAFLPLPGVQRSAHAAAVRLRFCPCLPHEVSPTSSPNSSAHGPHLQPSFHLQAILLSAHLKPGPVQCFQQPSPREFQPSPESRPAVIVGLARPSQPSPSQHKKAAHLGCSPAEAQGRSSTLLSCVGPI